MRWAIVRCVAVQHLLGAPRPPAGGDGARRSRPRRGRRRATIRPPGPVPLDARRARRRARGASRRATGVARLRPPCSRAARRRRPARRGAAGRCGAVGSAAAGRCRCPAHCAARSPRRAPRSRPRRRGSPRGRRRLRLVDHRRLVGLDLDERLALRHRVARALQPLRTVASSIESESRGIPISTTDGPPGPSCAAVILPPPAHRPARRPSGCRAHASRRPAPTRIRKPGAVVTATVDADLQEGRRCDDLLDQHGTEQGTDERAAPAEDARAAEHDGGDRLERVVDARSRPRRRSGDRGRPRARRPPATANSEHVT